MTRRNHTSALRNVHLSKTEASSTKVQEQFRRGSATITAFNVTITKDKTVTPPREMFLRYSCKKDQQIKLLVQDLKTEGLEAFQGDKDTDVLNVQKAFEYAERNDVIVAADDADILVLLCYQWNINLHDMYFSTETSEKGKAAGLKFWSIQSIPFILTRMEWM